VYRRLDASMFGRLTLYGYHPIHTMVTLALEADYGVGEISVPRHPGLYFLFKLLARIPTTRKYSTYLTVQFGKN